MDIVIPYKACANHTELIYCLRGIDKHVNNAGNLYIIGPDPGCFKDVVFINYPDRYNYANKERNVFEKIMAACDDPRISNDFFFMNDDHFLLKPVDPYGYPFYWKCNLSFSAGLHTRESPYGNALRNTMRVLTDANKPALNYDIHTPITYNKKLFKLFVGAQDWTVPYGYVIKSLYANSTGAVPVHMLDLKITHARLYEDIKSRINGRSIFSTAETAINDHMVSVMNELYPDKSRWEK